jgi:hypothetical protein
MVLLMFEKFFGPKSPEEVEKSLELLASKEFEIGVNGPSMFHAFNAVREENRAKGFGLTNNHLLNIVRDCAISNASSIEDSMYGGHEQTLANINSEIEKLRQELPEEERSK